MKSFAGKVFLLIIGRITPQSREIINALGSVHPSVCLFGSQTHGRKEGSKEGRMMIFTYSKDQFLINFGIANLLRIRKTKWENKKVVLIGRWPLYQGGL